MQGPLTRSPVETEKGKSYNREDTCIALFTIPFRDNLWVVVHSHLLDSGTLPIAQGVVCATHLDVVQTSFPVSV